MDKIIQRCNFVQNFSFTMSSSLQIALLIVFVFARTNGQLPLKLFTAKCAPAQYTNWTSCLWPHGNLQRVLNRFLVSARNKSCVTPPENTVKKAFDVLKKGDYISHPLYDKIPTQPCGFCGRKVKCCPSRHFLQQSYHSDYCDQTTSYCKMPLIDGTYLASLSAKYPGVTFNGDKCDFNQYSGREFSQLKSLSFYPFIKPLICQLYGTTQPKINCISTENECRCCCLKYVYRNGDCVLDHERASSDPETCS